MEVVGSDDEKIGEAFATVPGQFVVATGFVVRNDRCVPVDAVGRVGADRTVYLRYTKDDVLEQGWGTDPADIEPDAKAFDPLAG